MFVRRDELEVSAALEDVFCAPAEGCAGETEGAVEAEGVFGTADAEGRAEIAGKMDAEGSADTEGRAEMAGASFTRPRTSSCFNTLPFPIGMA